MEEAGDQVSYRIRELAERANVPEDFVRRLVTVGALPREEAGLGPREVRRARLLHSWEAAGHSVDSIVALVDRGALSLAFLDAPVMATPERLDRSYEQLAADRGVPLSLVQALHQAVGFAPPDPADRAGEDDATMLDVAELFQGAGAATRRRGGCWPCTPTACVGSRRQRRTTTRPTSSGACAPGGWTSAS